MADITMCANQKCIIRKDCFRFMAEPKEHGQSWADFKPDENGKCEYFWLMEA